MLCAHSTLNPKNTMLNSKMNSNITLWVTLFTSNDKFEYTIILAF